MDSSFEAGRQLGYIIAPIILVVGIAIFFIVKAQKKKKDKNDIV